MNNYIRNILKFGLFQGVTNFITLTAISYWLGSHNILRSLLVGLVGGIIVGISNALLRYKYAVPKYVLDAVSVDLFDDEEISFQTPANYTSGAEPISGKLFLTNKRIIFNNHNYEKIKKQFSIDINDVVNADSFKTLKIFTNGLCINTKSNESFKFIVDNLKQWISEIEQSELKLKSNVLIAAG